MTGAAWRKSSRSSGQQNSCVEVARGLPGAVAVRDSKDPHGPVLTLGPAGWLDFIADLKADENDIVQQPEGIEDCAWWPPSPFV